MIEVVSCPRVLLAIKLAMNYVEPFIVSNFGLLAHQRH
jgi:hypothetical protein